MSSLREIMKEQISALFHKARINNPMYRSNPK